MASLKDIRFKATFDSKGVITGLTQIDKKGKQVGKTLTNQFKKSSKSAGALGSQLKNLFVGFGLAFVVREFGRLAIAMKDAARDAVEIRTKFDQIFISLSASANRMADEFAEAFGLAGTTARELIGATGDLLVGFGFTEKAAFEMSVSVNRIAQDLASFQNFAGGAKGASFALTKALIGETESAKALSIAIRQTTPEFIDNVKALMRTEGATLLQAKAMEILRIIYEQSGKAVGDFERTQNSLANQERILNESFKETKEELGKSLIPLFNIATGVLIDFTNQVTDATVNFTENNFWDVLSIAALRFIQVSKGQSVQVTKILEGIQAQTKQALIPLISTYNELIPLISTYNQAVSEADLQFDIQSASIREMRKELENVNFDIEKQGKTSTILKGLITDRVELERTIKELLGGQTLSITKQIAEQKKLNQLREDFIFRTGGNLLKPFKNIPGLTLEEKGGFDVLDRPGLKNVELLDSIFNEAGKGFNELQVLTSGFVQTFQADFSVAWEGIFGEANSLLEKFFENIAAGFLSLAAGSIAKDLFGGILNILGGGGFFSGATGLLSKLFGSANTGGGDNLVKPQSNRPLVLLIDGSRMAETVLEPFLEDEMNRVLRINRF